MNRLELKAKAKSEIKGNIGTLFVITLIITGITLLTNCLVGFGTLVAFVAVTPAFSLSKAKIYLTLDQKEAKVGDAFEGFKEVFPAFKVHFLTYFYTFCWTLLFVIPGIIKAFAYSMAMYILAENPDMSASECIRRSKEMTYGHKLDLFVLMLSFFWWYLLCAVTFGIASIYVNPYINATLANVYKILNPESDSIEEAQILEIEEA